MTTNEYARRTTTPLTWILISGLIAIGMGCASAGVTPMAGSTDPGMLPRPGVLYVYDFAVGPEDVMVDSLGAEFMSEGEKLTKEEKTAYATAEAFSVALVGELRKEGINAQRINRGAVPALHSIVLKGQLRARVQAYQATARGLHRLVEAEAVAKGSKMPGMAVPVAGGAAMGSAATSAVISGGMNIAKETKGAMNPDAQRMAKKIAARAKAFYVRQGWL